jgi:anhydro-N-acetylmuramic acid kinase
LGDGDLLARLAGRPVAFDFRTADVTSGGHGAPLAPIYHVARAEASGLQPPLAILNIGGVANITLINRSGEITAYDTGPGNGLIDSWVEACGLGRFDADGRLAAAGQVHEDRLIEMMAHAHFGAQGPKSLDRYDFNLDTVQGLSAEDGAATLTAFTAEAVARALRPCAAAGVIVCGGGRRNPALLQQLSLRGGKPVITAERAGWRGDAIEAEAFAYLAARTLKGLPISYPGTTGVGVPMSGGQVVEPGAA